MTGIAIAIPTLSIIDVNNAIDTKIQQFRATLDLELAPIKLAVQGFIETKESLTRIEARQEASDAQTERNHAMQLRMHEENRVSHRQLLSTLERHLGAHDGMDKAADDAAEDDLRSSEKFQGWTKVGIAAAAGGGGWLVKWLNDHFPKLLHHK